MPKKAAERKTAKKETFVPDYLNAPWLTEEYIEKNGWYPVADDALAQLPAKKDRFKEFGDGKMYPMKSRSEYREGDIIIFFEYDEWTDKDGKRQTDRFITLDKTDIEEYKRGERELIPHGLVVHRPAE